MKPGFAKTTAVLPFKNPLSIWLLNEALISFSPEAFHNASSLISALLCYVFMLRVLT
jgi:hypothetical protein